MRRLTLYALAGAIAISACSDQNTESPTEPSVAPPSNTFTCAHGTYPLASVAATANDASLWKNKPAQTEALLRLGTIALLWNTCNDALARKAALSMLVWMDKNTAKNANPVKVTDLKTAILAGFGGASTTTADFVSGVYFPGEELVLVTPSKKAAIKLVDGAFNQPTLITVRRLPDETQLTDVPADFNQEPPFWDYDATNSSTDNTLGTHKVGLGANGKPAATIAFCFREDGGGHTYFPEPGASIGHNPVGGGFEIVEEVPVPTDLAPQLNCLQPPVLSSTNAFGSFSRYLSRAAIKVLLPEPLHALTVGTRGPIAGTPISLSPFGIVVPVNTLSFTDGGDPSGQSTSNDQIQFNCEGSFCFYPAVRLTDGEVGLSGRAITVTLIPVNPPAGVFTAGSTVTVNTDVDGVAEFNNLHVTAPFPESYELKFTGAGTSLTTEGSFLVDPPPVIP
jgi:hypothetical protein